MSKPAAPTDSARRALGFMGVAETEALGARGILVLDPCSTLVSPGALLADGMVLWPNVSVQVMAGGAVSIGADTILLPGTRVLASSGIVRIGEGAEIGAEGGFTIDVRAADNVIEIGAGARLLGGGSLSRSNQVGDGAQILGPIRAQECRLGSGDTHHGPDPDRRGGVLKGAGVARRLVVPQGRVVQAFGLFSEAAMHWQTFFHPQPELSNEAPT